MGTLGILQYYNKFCVYYGFLQVFNFENIKNISKVKDLSDSEKDKQKALKLIVIAASAALVYAVLYIVLV